MAWHIIVKHNYYGNIGSTALLHDINGLVEFDTHESAKEYIKQCNQMGYELHHNEHSRPTMSTCRTGTRAYKRLHNRVFRVSYDVIHVTEAISFRLAE